MLPPGPWATAHAPALLETPDGSLLCAWFAGSFEGSGDVSIVCARLPKGAARWEALVQVSHDETRGEQNPSLFLAPDGAVWAVYTAQLDRVPGKDNMQFTSVIRRQKSTDGGRIWGEPDVLFAREGSFCRQPIQVLASGRWIFANWLCSDSASGLAGDPTAFQISDDQGCTWRTVEMPGSNGRVHANGWSLRRDVSRRSCGAVRQISFIAVNRWTTAIRGANRCPRSCPITTPASAPSSCKVDALPLPITPPIRLRRSQVWQPGPAFAARLRWPSARTAALHGR